MDFFTAQDRSRRQTRLLLLLFLLATLAVVAGVTAIVGLAFYGATFSNVAPPDSIVNDRERVLWYTAAGTLIFIACASLFRIATLRAGGARIARELGGAPVPGDTRDPLQRRLLNVVEEMAIASGVPVPAVYVLENEAGINAFAAGFNPEDAVVAVTRGTLERLNRDELQGVIAHEFSHILNGDMRLNIRLMGPLFGILALGLIGRMMIRSARRTRYAGSSSRSSGNSGAAFLLIGAGLAVVGYIGMFLGRLIKAGVSRQREYLADASAVQFTRQQSGIAGALKKIAGLNAHSYLRSADAEEVSHMLFASGLRRLGQLFATHPPLMDRIQKLDPQFTLERLVELQSELQTLPETPGVAGVGGSEASGAMPERFAISPGEVAASVGNPDRDDVRVAHDIHAALPADLIEAAHSSEDAILLAVALVLHSDASVREKQRRILTEQLGARRAARCEQLSGITRELGDRFRLPLFDLLFPALRRRPPDQLDFLLQLVRRLVETDLQVELFEYCLARILEYAVDRHHAPHARRPTRLRRSDVREAVLAAFAVLAWHGHAQRETASVAVRAGLARVGMRNGGVDGALDALAGPDWAARLDASLAILRRIPPRHQRRLVEALTVTASHDGFITVAESELLRVFCTALDIPMPPLYSHEARA